ncbi:MAG TPA: glycosyltransferase, partial [Candidatus Poseidoniales archaeon]
TPLKPFEAMAMEKAVIASDVHALTEIVQHEFTGLLFEKGSSSSLAGVLLSLIEDPMLRSQLGHTAREWVRSERDWNAISHTLGEAYGELEVGSSSH